MNKQETYYLGKVVKPFGFKGDLVLFFDVDQPEEYTNLDGVYIEINKVLVLYPIESIRLNGNRATVRFENLTPEESLKLIGKELYLPLALLPKLEGNKFYFHEVIGFGVVDEEKGDIGIIETVIEYPAQPIFSIKYDQKEILIPIIDKIIQKVDREAKIIYINAPVGLIDLYLS
ncbi:MAG: ribosome maturation factor RimM [Bacteroidales bacterium]|jgi:16S rRNA processing protein RimM|nr:ribosome maturation factor RimM [Bacteroidales bacterium]MDX9798101.1 ribosome maturation factor RimM [Bacteroidales bacterium]